MHRTKIKKITPEATLLKRLREQRQLSMRDAGEAVGKSVAWISHAENGRVDLTDEHFNLLIPLYGQTKRSFDAYLNGTAFLASPFRQECINALHELPDNLVESIHPMLIHLLKFTKQNSKSPIPPKALERPA